MIQKLKSLFKESLVYSTGNMLVKLGGFLLMPLYLKYTTAEEFGLIMLLEVIFQFIQSIAAWGSKFGLQRFYYDMKTDKEKSSLFYTSVLFNIFTTFFAVGFVLILLNAFKSFIFSYDISSTVILLFIGSTFFRLLLDLPYILLKLQQKAISQTVHQTLNIAITIVVTYFTLDYLNLGLAGIFWGQLLANALSLVILLPIIIKNSTSIFDKKRLGEMIHFGIPLVLSNAITILLTLSDRYIISFYNTLTDVGSYSIAFKISGILQLIVLMPFISSYTFEYYRHINKETTDRFYLKSFTYFILFMSVLGIGIILFSKEIIYLLSVGESTFFDAIPLIPIMIMGLIFSGMRQVFTLPLNKAKNTKRISLIIISIGVLNVILNFIFIPLYGKMGAAATSTFCQLMGAIWFFIMAKKIDTETYEIWKIFKIIVICYLLIYTYIYFPVSNMVLDYAIKLLIIPVFILLLYAFKCFEGTEIEKMKGAWIKWRKLKNISVNIKSLK